MRGSKLYLIASFLIILSTLGSAQGASTELQINVTDAEPMPLQSGQYADIWLRVKNVGDNTAENAVIEINEQFPFHLDDRKSRWELGELKPGQRYTVKPQVRVNENAVFGENDLQVRKTSGNQDVWIEDSIALDVRTDDRSLIVSDLEFPEKVEPGSSAEMNLTLENLANSRFRNIDVSIDTDDLPVATSETSRRRISGLNAGETEEVSFKINVDGDADNKLHDLPIDITYQDQAGNQLNLSETTGVNIGGYPNIDVDIEESDIRSPGRGQVTLRIVNKGEGRARFAEVSLEDSDQYEILSKDSIYLGSMIADDFQTAEFDLYVKEGENLELPVKVDYRDGEGNQTHSFDIQRDLYSSEELRDYGMTGSSSVWVVGIVLVLLIAGLGAFYWRRKRE